MIFEHEFWCGGAWRPSTDVRKPRLVGADGSEVPEAAFRERVETRGLACIVDGDTDPEGWSYGTFLGRIGQRRAIGRRAPLPLDRVRRRRWVDAGAPATSSMRSKASSPRLDESDWEAIRKIMQLLATYLGKRCPSDFLSVATDPTVGFRVMRQHRQAYAQALDAACQPMAVAEASRHAEVFADASRAALFACAAYGAPMREGRLDGVGAFAGGAAAHFFGRWTAAENTEAFVDMTGVARDDVLLTSWVERTFEPSFCLAWSHERRWLVLSVRGSVDWRAVLTDVAAHPAPICGGIAHEGMVRSARTVVERSLPLIRQCLRDRPTYRVVCTGHSLGAGVAILAALLLRSGGQVEGGDLDEGEPPALASTLAYGMGVPPLVNPELADRMRDWTLSMQRGVDFISRLSVFSVDRFIFELTQASAAKMATDWFMRSIGKDASYQRFLRHFGEDMEVAELLVPPGRIVHFDTRRDTRRDIRRRGRPMVYWATSGFYQRYMLGATMISDHLPRRYHRDITMLAALAEQEVANEQQTLGNLETFVLPGAAASPSLAGAPDMTDSNSDSVPGRCKEELALPLVHFHLEELNANEQLNDDYWE